MTMTIPQPDTEALKRATFPFREPVFNVVKSQENGRIILRVFAHFYDGSIDNEVRDLGPENESHMVFIENEEAAASELRQVLKRRNPPPAEKN